MDKLTVDQLKKLATDYNIKGRAKLRRKSELLKELRKITELVEMYDNNGPQIEETPATPHRFNPETPPPGPPPPRPATPPEQNIKSPQKNIPNQKERPTPAPRKNIPKPEGKTYPNP